MISRDEDPKIEILIEETREELARAHREFPVPLNSPHEGYAVLLEEIDELWDEVKKKRRDRDPIRMREECVQIAAMAIRFAVELT